MQANSYQTLSNIRVIAIAENAQQRLAFSDTIRQWGMELLDCIAFSQLKEKHFEQHVDVWLIDNEKDVDIIHLIEQKSIDTFHSIKLVGFTPAPYMTEMQLYAKWQRQLKRKLAQALNRPELVARHSREQTVAKPWRYVVVLGASMGGPLAIKEFLDALPPTLPITLILAHHFSAAMIHTLPRILSRHNDWRCEVMTTTQQLQSGRCLIVPIENSVICDSKGRVILQKKSWEGSYQPSINQLYKNSSMVFGNRLISIIFSGMGDDGKESIETLCQNQSLVWAQSPESSTCDSQPKNIIETGKVTRIGTPTELANALVELVKSPSSILQPQL